MTAPLILIVDDDESLRNIVRRILEANGFHVIVACDGAEGVRLAQEICPVLVLMDLAMPVRDGWEANADLKADPATAGIPVAAFSSFDFPEARERARREGFAAFIAKPQRAVALVASVSALLPEGAAVLAAPPGGG